MIGMTAALLSFLLTPWRLLDTTLWGPLNKALTTFFHYSRQGLTVNQNFGPANSNFSGHSGQETL
jgi:hypothetical protein